MAKHLPVSIFEEPGCLIASEHNTNKLEINEDILEQVERINGPIVVVAIAGIYRTGKSYLLNRLALSQKQDLGSGINSTAGFALGSTVQSKTKGIWIWARTHPVKDGYYMLIIDTEGLSDVEKNDANHDNWIFVLALLMSSVFCYNQLGKIERQSLEQLRFVAKLAERIEFGDGTTDQLAIVFPKFIYVLRDFALDLEIDGEEVTADEYLEHSLRRQKDEEGVADSTKKYIRRYFLFRKCFTFCPPLLNWRLLKNLENLDDMDLDPDFLKETKKFCKHIFHDDNVKTFRHCKELTGRQWAGVLREYVKHIRDGKLPSVNDAYQSMVQIENSRLLDEYFQKYMDDMTAIQLPCGFDELHRHHENSWKKCCKEFIKNCLADEETYRARFVEKAGNEYEALMVQNEQLLAQKAMLESERKEKELAQQQQKALNERLFELSNSLKKEQLEKEQAEIARKKAEVKLKAAVKEKERIAAEAKLREQERIAAEAKLREKERIAAVEEEKRIAILDHKRIAAKRAAEQRRVQELREQQREIALKERKRIQEEQEEREKAKLDFEKQKEMNRRYEAVTDYINEVQAKRAANLHQGEVEGLAEREREEEAAIYEATDSSYASYYGRSAAGITMLGAGAACAVGAVAAPTAAVVGAAGAVLYGVASLFW